MSVLHRKFDSLAGYITLMEVLDRKFHHHLFWLFKFGSAEAHGMSTEPQPPQMHHKYLFEQQ